MSGVLRLANTGGSNGRSTIVAAASTDATFTLPPLGGTLLTSNFSNPGGTITLDGATINITNGDLNVDNGTLFVDETNNYVGIGTTTPSNPLNVIGAADFDSGPTGNINRLRINPGTDGTGVVTLDARVPSGFSQLAFATGGGGGNSQERARINGDGKLLIGTDTPRQIDTGNFQLQIEGTAQESGFSTTRNTDGVSGSNIRLVKTRSTTVGGFDAVAEGDSLGVLSWWGTDGTTCVEGAYISSNVDGLVDVDSVPGRLGFGTTAVGDQGPTERLSITNDGRVGVNMGTTNYLGLFQVRHDIDYSAAGVDFDNEGSATLCLSNQLLAGDNVPISSACLLFAGRNGNGSTFRAAITGSSDLKFYVGENLNLNDDPGFRWDGTNLLIGDTQTNVPGNTINALVTRVNNVKGARIRVLNDTQLDINSGDLLVFNSTSTEGGNTIRTSYIGNWQSSNGTLAGKPCGVLMLCRYDNTTQFIYPDINGLIRTSTSQNNIGLQQGTVIGDQTSDVRLKKSIESCTYGLNEIKKLETIFYKFDSSSEEGPVPRRIGFSAQQTKQIIPEAVYETGEILNEEEEPKLAMQYVQIIPVLVNAIKELEQTLSETVAELKLK